MKAILPLFLAVTLSSTFVAQAQTPAAPSAAPKAADSPAKEELGKVVEAIKAKLAAGKKSEEELKEELAQFDVIAEKYKSDTEAGSNILFMKAMLYLQIINQPEKGREVLAKIKKQYPDTKIGQTIDRVLASIDEQEASTKLNAELKVGSAFPKFSVTSLEGKPLALENYKGKVVLIDFWATWCGPCVQELPNVLNAYKLYHDKGFEIIGISLDESKDKLQAFLKENSMTWPQFFDGKGWENELAQKYGINSIPATYLLDAKGNIIDSNLRGEALDAAVAKAKEVVALLRPHMMVFYDEAGAIGRRYRRQDEAGTPFGVTIDFDTIGENGPDLANTVTLRHRDSMQQERVAIADLPARLIAAIS